MQEIEMVLTQAAEECVEIAQRISKALRFGLYEIQSGQALTNHDRIKEEFNDLLGVLHFLDERFGTCFDVGKVDWDAVHKKVDKTKKYLEFSKNLGTLVDSMDGRKNAFNSAIDCVIDNSALTQDQIKHIESLKWS